MSEKQLKRLGFVHQGASYAYSYTGTAEKLYKTARSFAPTFVEPTLAQVEDRVVAITAPVVAQAQDLSEKALHIADDQSWPLYSKVVSTGVSTLSWATTTTPYKLGAQYMYPLVQPVADPALAKITNSKVINGTLSYWKPTASAA
ncbi:oil globule associated protein [Haematococcus lacustris]|uniref:Oil globule associated protein n=1 Tax=Haematococcus lacustris TaxID=44745 RepID=A0A699ZTK0_HAELA|nr:oil globule associated protein [Haematococcus lacustris]